MSLILNNKGNALISLYDTMVSDGYKRENAHITVRPPLWWKGVIDMIAVEYPHVRVYLITSTAWQKSELTPTFSAQKWIEQEKFVVDL
jgi:hypothetical protein